MTTTNIIRLLLVASILLSLLMLSNCADPLDITSQPAPPQEQSSDTLFAIDTIFVVDTITQDHVDTVIVVDTVVEGGTDTLIVVDTVIRIEPDTIFVIDTLIQDNPDTIFVIDTVVQTDPDTIIVTDTVTYTDTVTVVDTVVVTDDTTQMMCGRIEACKKEIVWLLQNSAGEFRLSLAAYIENDQPPQSLSVEVDGSEYVWNTADASNLVVDTWLNENATIRISSKKPPARGHAVSICLSYIRQ